MRMNNAQEFTDSLAHETADRLAAPTETLEELLADAIDVQVGRNGTGAVCLRMGPPEIWINTRRGVVQVATRTAYSEVPLVDRIGLAEHFEDIARQRGAPAFS